MIETNPYSPPKIAKDSQDPAAPDRRTFPTVLTWTVIYFVNLIIPVLFANQVIVSAGWLGVLLALGMFYAAGCWICLQRPKQARLLNVGATVVTVTQLVPLIHIVAGLIGLAAALGCGQGRYGGESGIEEITTELGGWIAATVTAGLLAGVAFSIGAVVSTVQKVFRPRGR